MTIQDKRLTELGVRVRCHDCAVQADGFCGAPSCQHLHHLDRISHTQSFERQQTLISEGDPADSVFNVVDGVVRLTKLLADGRRAVVGFLYPGHFVGLSSLTVHTYSAEAVTPVIACRIDRRRLDALCLEIPALEHRLRDMVSYELVAAQNRMLTLGRKSLNERMASFLLELAELDGSSEPDILSLPMTRSDVADYLGLTIETVSRCLTAMCRDGLIELPDKRSVRIRDWPTMRCLAEGSHACRAV